MMSVPSKITVEGNLLANPPPKKLESSRTGAVMGATVVGATVVGGGTVAAELSRCCASCSCCIWESNLLMAADTVPNSWITADLNESSAVGADGIAGLVGTDEVASLCMVIIIRNYNNSSTGSNGKKIQASKTT